MAARPGSHASQRPSPSNSIHTPSWQARRSRSRVSLQNDDGAVLSSRVLRRAPERAERTSLPMAEGFSPARRDRLHPEGSFIASAAFTHAPLNSRVPMRKVSGGTPRRKPSAREPLSEDELSDLSGDGSQIHRDIEEQFPDFFPNNLKNVPELVQEALLIEDLLFVLMGIEGTYVRLDPDIVSEKSFDPTQEVSFVFHPDLDPSLKGLAAQIVPIAAHYITIDSFIEKYSHFSHGLVFHALCAILRNKMRDYLVLIAELEHKFNTSPDFRLQRLWYYVFPTLRVFSHINTLTQQLTPKIQPPSITIESEDDSSDDEAVRAVKADMRENDPIINSAANMPVKGGEILAILFELSNKFSGDPEASLLYSELLLHASQPYAQILVHWIRTGTLDDPYDEFMVKQSKSIVRRNLETDYIDEVWEKMYTLRDDDGSSNSREAVGSKGRNHGLAGGAIIPEFLETWKVKVLLAGKYLNVIRECGSQINVPGREDQLNESGELIDMKEEKFHRKIEEAYTYANRTLLDLLVTSQSLIPRLRSLKHFFFLIQGDSITHFLDLAAHDLKKEKKDASIIKLQSLLDLVIRNPSSTSKADPFKEDVKVTLASESVFDWLQSILSVRGGSLDRNDAANIISSGSIDALVDSVDQTSIKKDSSKKKDVFKVIDALALEYTVKFPLSLVLSRKTILRYQLIFRNLLSLKHIEEQLNSVVFVEHKKSPVWRKSCDSIQLTQWKEQIFALRERMLAYVQRMYDFTVDDVLKPNWTKMINKIEKCQTVDELLREHVDFLDTCLKECMLTSEKLLNVHTKIIRCIQLFIDYAPKFSASLSASLNRVELSGTEPSKEDMDKLYNVVSRFESNFNHHASVHSQLVTYYASTETIALLALAARSTLPGKAKK